MEPAAVARPVQVLSRVGAHPDERQRLRLGSEVDALAGARQRGHERLVALDEGQPVAVGGHGELGGGLGLHDLARVVAVQAQADERRAQLDLVLHGAARDVDAVARRAELRRLPVAGDTRGLARAVGRHAEDAGLAAGPRREQVRPARLRVHDAPAVRREARLQVQARSLRQQRLLAGGELERTDGSRALVVPGREHHSRAVAREAREQLEAVVGLREPARRSRGQLLEVETPEGRVDDTAAVRRHRGPAQLPHVEAVGSHGRREAHRLPHLARVLDVERDLARGPAGDRDAPELALRPHHELAAVRRPAERRVHAVDRPGFLQVALEAFEDRTLLPGRQVHREERAPAVQAPHERERLAVRRRHRADRAARAGHEGLDRPSLQVQALDRVDLPPRVAVVLVGAAGRGVLGEVEVAGVRREGRLAEVLLPVRLLVECYPLAAAAVVEPDLAGAEAARAGVVLARGDVLAARMPDRVVDEAEVLLRHLRGVLAVRVHRPDVVAAAGVAQVGDPLAVGREARLHLPRDRVREARGFPALDRQRVEVAEQVEDERPTVGAHVDAHPRPAARVDRDRSRFARRRVHVPLFFRLRLVLLFRLCRLRLFRLCRLLSEQRRSRGDDHDCGGKDGSSGSHVTSLFVVRPFVAVRRPLSVVRASPPQAAQHLRCLPWHRQGHSSSVHSVEARPSRPAPPYNPAP